MNDQELKLIFDNDRKADAWPAAPDAVTGDSELDDFSDLAANSVNAGDDAGDDAVRAGTDEDDAGENGREDDAFDGEAAAQDLGEGAANTDYDEFEVTSPEVTSTPSGTDATCDEFDDFEVSGSAPSVPPKSAEARWLKGTTRGVLRPPPGDGNY